MKIPVVGTLSSQAYVVLIITAVSMLIQFAVIVSIPEARRFYAKFWPIALFGLVMSLLVFMFFLYGINCLTRGSCDTYAWIIVGLLLISTLFNVVLLLTADKGQVAKNFARRQA